MSAPTRSALRRKLSLAAAPEAGNGFAPDNLGTSGTLGGIRLFERFERVLADYVAHLAVQGEALRGAVRSTGRRPRSTKLALPVPPSRVLAVELPMTKNDGSPVPAEAWNAVLSAITRRYGGWNCEPRVGLWRGGDGTLYLDASIRIEVWGTCPQALLALLRRQIRPFGQDCIVMRECVPAAFHAIAARGAGRTP